LAGIDARILLFFFGLGLSAKAYFSFSSFFCLHGALGTDGFFSLGNSSSSIAGAFLFYF